MIESIKVSYPLGPAENGKNKFSSSSNTATIPNIHATDDAHALTSIPESPRLPFISDSFDYTADGFDPIYGEEFDQHYDNDFDAQHGWATVAEVRLPVKTSAGRETFKEYSVNKAELHVMEVDNSKDARLEDAEEGKSTPSTSRKDVQFIDASEPSSRGIENSPGECEYLTPSRPADCALPISTSSHSTEIDKNGDLPALLSSKNDSTRQYLRVYIQNVTNGSDSEAVPDAYIRSSGYDSISPRRDYLISRSLWNLQVAKFRSKFSDRGLKYPGYPPSSLNPLWNEWWRRIKKMHGYN
jgi:hypothetical protein